MIVKVTNFVGRSIERPLTPRELGIEDIFTDMPEMNRVELTTRGGVRYTFERIHE